ncbi:MAG TPA: carboxypeptidase regulatory-like domain-containing protein [Streptosporangiaceae bacterium]
MRHKLAQRAVALAASGLAVLGLTFTAQDPAFAASPATQASAHVTPAHVTPAHVTPAHAAPADAKAVCGKPAKNHAACMALLRTNVKAHKGITPHVVPSGYGPTDLQSAYNLPSATAGGGQTVAVVDAGDDPTAEANLAIYRQQYGLPACTTANGCFEKVNQEGQQSNYPPVVGTWPIEESLDIDMVSAICPACHILLVEANNTLDTSLGSAVDEAVALGAKYVSNSYGGGDFGGELQDDQYYNHPGVAVTASAGDSGYGVNYPAASQYVTAVGGTTLTQDSSTARGWTETAWGTNPNDGEGTGSGCSAYEPKPSWQTDTGCTNRTVADVSADADPNTGVAVYDTTGEGGWIEVGGTSVASPIIASTYALAGTPTAGTYPSSYPYKDPAGLNDITSGANGTCTPAYLCTAGPGYDGPTGLGTPDGVAAFAGGPRGDITGRVTDAATADPIFDATVSADGQSASTDEAGDYTLNVPPGAYRVSVTDFGYAVKNATGVQVGQGQTTTQNFALTKAPGVTLSGTVTDGSGHKWPLYAEVTLAGTSAPPAYTSPYTGQYSITVPAGADYTLNVSPVYPGYTAATATVHVGTAAAVKNVKVTVDASACDAPGYAVTSGGTCAANHGGLVTGVVTDGNTGDPVNGATIVEAGRVKESATSAATSDPAIPGGFYWLFSPATGRRNFTAASGGYTSASSGADVAANTVSRQDLKLQAGKLTVTPSAASVTEPLGATKTVKVTLGNDGTEPVHVTLGAQNGGYTPTGQANGAQADAAGPGWTKITKYPIPITSNAVAYDPQTGDLYSVGGVTTAGTTAAGYVYDPGTGHWTAIAPAPKTLASAYAAFIDGTLYLAGGQQTIFAGSQSSAVYAYTPGSNSWTQVASLPQALFAGATAVLDGQLYAIGGCTLNAGACTNAAYRYDPAANAWTKIANYPTIVNAEACAGIDGEIACTGGNTSAGEGNEGTADTYLYNPASDTWSRGANLPYTAASMGYAGANGQLQVASGIGITLGGVALKKARQYNPATNTWSMLPDPGFYDAYGGSSCGFYEVGSGISGQSAEVLPGYDQCDGAGGLAWLSENQASLEIAPGASTTVTLQLNAADVDQPGTYRALLYASTDTPYRVQVNSLTMNVKASALSEISGSVTTASGHPIDDATVAITGVDGGTSGKPLAAVKTDPSGHYQWWLAAGHDPVQVSAAEDGYQPQATTVAIEPRKPADADFALKSDPSSLPYASGGAAGTSGTTAKTAAHVLSGSGGRAKVRGSSPASPKSQPADVKAVCGKPTKIRATCLALVRTNVKAHKGVIPNDTPSGYGPSDLQSAYNLPSATAGSGETVAVVDAGDDPTAESDLGVYRAQYGLPACTTANGCFEKVNQEGQQGNYPSSNGDWPVEESLDIDMVSAVCPNCHILLVEANSAAVTDLGASVNEAVALGAKFISNSYSSSESSAETGWDSSYYDHPGVAVTASAGDDGYGVGYPATSQYVTSVGGTTLTQDPGSARGWSETAWGSASGGQGTGSGCSAYEPKPAWQTDTGCADRTVADVSADADPNTGVAFYDTGNGGWGVVGGTSVSSPVIASTFALAGLPADGTYPSSYPYVSAVGGLNDVTSGSNGTCTPAYLCTAGPGYDGPTGLGTPNGVTAFTPANYGTLAGRVTDSATGDPLAGATVTVGSRSATTNSSGQYSLDVASGSYSASASGWDYAAQTATGIQVSSGQTTTQNFGLAKKPTTSVTGIVTDGSGHKWPLYAKITVAGDPGGPVFTNPGTGGYTITLPVKATYTVTVAPVYPGYTTQTITVHVGTKGLTRNVKVAADKTLCDAPGYGLKYNGADEQFTGWTGTAPQDGWTVTDNNGSGSGWEFDDASSFGNLTGGTGGFAEAESFTNSADENTSLVSPSVNLSNNQAPQISFDQIGFCGLGGCAVTGEVDLSLDGGSTWQTVWGPQAPPTTQQATAIPIPQAAGQSDVQVRFAFANTNPAVWQLDNVVIGTQSCTTMPGGLVAGVVSDANTGDPVNGATVTEAGKHGGSATSAATADPAIPGGFYWMFSPSGTRSFTATDGTYVAATASVAVARNAVTSRNWSLQAGHLTVTPASLSAAMALGESKTVKVTYTNDGGAALNMTPGTQDGGFTPATGPSGSATPDAGQSKSGWTSIAPYPISGIYDNTVATDPQTGDVYSVGGLPGDIYQGSTAAGYKYDPASGQWSQIAPLPQPLNLAGGAFVDGTLYVVGGESQTCGACSGPYLSTLYAYTPESNSWTQAASLPQPTGDAGIAVLDGELYMIGGCTGSPDYCRNDQESMSYRYDPATNAWAQIADYPIPIVAEACAGVDGEVACAGGSPVTKGAATDQVYLFNPVAGAWSQGADMPYNDYSMAYSGANGELQVAGGITGEVNNGLPETQRASQYDPASNTWTTLPALSAPGAYAGGSCGMYVIGEIDGSSDQALPGYDQCDGSDNTGWLSTSVPQGGFDLAPGQSVTLSVRLKSSEVDQPGSYAAALYASTNTPYPNQITDVTMQVTPPAGWSLLSGTVTNSAGKPVADATVQVDTSASSVKSGPVDYTLRTSPDGTYQWWLDPAADDPLQVIAAEDGYIQRVTQVKQPGGSLDFALRRFPSVSS